MESPNDAHRPRSFMRHIIGESKECVRRCLAELILELADEEHDAVVVPSMMNIPLPCFRIFTRRALALPVKEYIVNRIVFIHRGWGVILIGLVQRDEEYICTFLSIVIDAFSVVGIRFVEPQAHPDLTLGVSTMKRERCLITDI